MRWPLESLQRAFGAAVLDDGRTPALAAALDGADGAARLAQYRTNLHAGWEHALTLAFPVVRALVGAEFFRALALRYGALNASGSGDLHALGANFAAFVSAFEQTQALPYLSDVAALEWLVHRAQRAADAAPLARERLAALTPDELLAARFGVQPACAWIESPFAVASLWFAHQADSAESLPSDVDQGECALVLRPRWQVRVLRARRGELAALGALKCGADMDAAIAAALRVEPGFDFAKAILRWLEHDVLVALEPAR